MTPLTQTVSESTLTLSTESGALGEPADEAAARALWAALTVYIAGRAWMRLYVPPAHRGAKGKYDDAKRLTTRNLPDRPAAVCIYDGTGRTGVLVFDFDPKPRNGSAAAWAEARAAVERDAAQLISWVRQAGGQVVADRSPRGGIHVYVPLAMGERLRCASLRPLYRQLQRLLPSLDIKPMDGEKQGCITPPGARCKGGGFRTLYGGMSVADAVAAFKTRSVPRLVAHLRALLADEGELDVPETTDEFPVVPAVVERIGADERLPADLVTARALRPWVPAFLRYGTVPELTDPAGDPWTPSHARLSVLNQHAARGWSLADIRATKTDPDWAAFWAAYACRNDRVRRLRGDWERAFAAAKTRMSSKAEKSSQPAHESNQVHTGGLGDLRDLRWKLAAARKWVLLCGEFPGRQQWTALIVVTALAAALSMTGGDSAAVGKRWLSVAAGLCGEEAVSTVLRKLRSTPGSPVRFLSRWDARSHCGDRYTLVSPRLEGTIVRAADWEALAARPEPLEAIWTELGFASWWVYTVLQAIEPGFGETVAPEELAAAARVSLSTVHRASRRLQQAGLVDFGHGWIARSGRSPRRVPDLSARTEQRRADRIVRHQRERAEFWSFWDLVTANYDAREISGYTSVEEVNRETDDYLAAAFPDVRPPDDDGGGDDLAALTLLQLELGAEIIDNAPEQRVMPAVGQGQGFTRTYGMADLSGPPSR
ncbi:hypothetical protein [Nocardia otitidiscaviarum]|uniref:hypothetical protein n=1 Tax=Nocardia otitidiscaviarum TaxID=1823 RepID=UPI00058432B4|nr:hypothetical protein [Nocardia otitidiscaviarum]